MGIGDNSEEKKKYESADDRRIPLKRALGVHKMLEILTFPRDFVLQVTFWKRKKVQGPFPGRRSRGLKSRHDDPHRGTGDRYTFTITGPFTLFRGQIGLNCSTTEQLAVRQSGSLFIHKSTDRMYRSRESLCCKRSMSM